MEGQSIEQALDEGSLEERDAPLVGVEVVGAVVEVQEDLQEEPYPPWGPILHSSRYRRKPEPKIKGWGS